MEIQRTEFATRQQNVSIANDCACQNDIEIRLNVLLAANEEIRREKEIFKDFAEEVEASILRHPIDVKQTFAYFGLLLGTFPPAAIFFKMFISPIQSGSYGILILLFLMNLTCAVSGYFSGKMIGRIIGELEKRSWHTMLLLLPFAGILWGLFTGAAGGVLFFVIGAFFGAIIASMVGSIALLGFTIPHRLLKKGDLMERNHFLPVAFGITFAISAFILGL